MLELLLHCALGSLEVDLLVQLIDSLHVFTLSQFLTDLIDVTQLVHHLGDIILESPLLHDLLDSIFISELLEFLLDTVLLSGLVKQRVDLAVDWLIDVQGSLLEVRVNSVASTHLEDLLVGEVLAAELLKFLVHLVQSPGLLDLFV